MTQPPEPEIPINSPDVTNSPMPIVPENAMPRDIRSVRGFSFLF